MRALFVNNLNNNSNANGNNNLNNSTALARITQSIRLLKMPKTYNDLCSYNNLLLAFKKARKKKTTKPYVIEFEKDLENNLLQLQNELRFLYYKPKPLENFILRDPKTRKISKSDFRDRIVHHALCNIIEPIFEKTFIFDSYANRKGKGTLKAVKRYDQFKKKVSQNFTRKTFVLKADIYHYFETIKHSALIKILNDKIKDAKVIWLIKQILNNHSSKEEKNTGMPLGNLTSQFFANIYLNELDQFVKHELKAEYYIRYVDDFVILSNSFASLHKCKIKISEFLERKLGIKLHPDKSKIMAIHRGTEFLGFKIFQHHKLLKKKNMRKIRKKIEALTEKHKRKEANYDKIYDTIEGWMAYAKQANTYNLRQKMLKIFEKEFMNEISTKEINNHMKAAKSHQI